MPAGVHRVTFSFAPPYVGWGYLAFVAGLIVLLAPVLARRLGVHAPSRRRPVRR